MLTRELERSAFYRDRVPRLAETGVGVRLRLLRLDLLPRILLADAELIVRRIFTARGIWPVGRAVAESTIPGLMLLLVALVWLYAFWYESKWRGYFESAPSEWRRRFSCSCTLASARPAAGVHLLPVLTCTSTMHHRNAAGADPTPGTRVRRQ